MLLFSKIKKKNNFDENNTSVTETKKIIIIVNIRIVMLDGREVIRDVCDFYVYVMIPEKKKKKNVICSLFLQFFFFFVVVYYYFIRIYQVYVRNFKYNNNFIYQYTIVIVMYV